MRRVLPALCAAALLAGPARADVEDLSGGRRGPLGSTSPATLVLRAQGGTDYAVFGKVGAALSWFNEWGLFEIEGGVGSALPGLQIGFAFRKLFGQGNDFLVAELGIGYDTSAKTGTAPTASARHASWTNIGMGFEHRGPLVSLTLTGGLTLLSFSERPSGYLQAGLGIGF